MKTSPPTSLRSPTSQEKHTGSEAGSLGDDSFGDKSTIIDPALEKVVWRKMDKWILPVVAMFYLLSFLVSTTTLCRPSSSKLGLNIRIGPTLEMLVSQAYRKISI